MKKRFYKERKHWSDAVQEEEGHTVNLPLYHGVRTKNPERIRKEGICSFRTLIDTRREIIIALKHFGKYKLLYTAGGRGDLIRAHIRKMQDPTRRTIYLTSVGKEAACSWATRNPEFVSLTLSNVDISNEDIFRYLTDRYGEPYIIKLKETYPIKETNICSYQRCLLPEEIESIERCL